MSLENISYGRIHKKRCAYTKYYTGCLDIEVKTVRKESGRDVLVLLK